ncbi:MAG: hypothetical protein ACOVN4_08290, partial [Bosea sp. (in: a-proteobacteria)]
MAIRHVSGTSPRLPGERCRTGSLSPHLAGPWVAKGQDHNRHALNHFPRKMRQTIERTGDGVPQCCQQAQPPGAWLGPVKALKTAGLSSKPSSEAATSRHGAAR